MKHPPKIEVSQILKLVISENIAETDEMINE